MPLCGSVSVVHPHCCLQCVVCVHIIVCICVLAIDAALTSNRKQGSSDRAPLRFSESHGAEVKWEDVGSDVHWFVSHAVSLQGQGSVSVADVPVRGLDGLDLACPDCLPVLMLCLHLTLDFLHDGQHQRGRITRGEEESGLCHCFVFHAVSMADFGGNCKG